MWVVALAVFAWGVLPCEGVKTSLPPGAAVEEGLEEAVKWKWEVAPAATEGWGMELPPEPEPGSPEAEAAAAAVARPRTYEVVRGDALVKIARKFHMSVDQLKQFNGLTGNLIRVGDILRIPTPEELVEMSPPPAAEPVGEGKAGKEPVRPAGRPGLELPPTTVQELELQTVLLQVILDREMFSQGPIDGESGPVFDRVLARYLATHPYISDKDELKVRALESIDYPYVSYALRPEDFRFIQPRKEEPAEVPAAAPPRDRRRGAAKPPEPPPPPPVEFDELSAAEFLGYRSAWEFVAERFHCDEAFLRRINPHVERAPLAGTVFQVPNVIPFEIENALDEPLQPEADPSKPVAATVVNFTTLEITRAGRLVAIVPLASARPGLRGRGTWTVLEAIPRPRLLTRYESRDAPPPPPPKRRAPEPPEPPEPAETLEPGPNNPVGVMWIHLARAGGTEPLPYGLHGTSIPAEMRTRQGIGGLRLANWDIVRVARLLPVGTPLQWESR